jgi:ADP-ribosyl-[dinitrogen reductase] hydrolase
MAWKQGSRTGVARRGPGAACSGVAAGDALGTTLEFMPRGTFEPIDDNSMGLCLAESLLERGGFDPVDQLGRHLRWLRTGHLGSNGRWFEIGIQTHAALAEFERTRSAQLLPPDLALAGNGSIMRLPAVPVAYAPHIEAAVDYSGRSSLTTHPAP